MARCPNCAHVAKYGITIFEAKMRKLKEARIRAAAKARLAVPLRKEAIKKASRKGRAQALAVSKMKRGVKAGAIDGGYVECAGCGGKFDTIDASHKVPLSQSAALAADPENISLLCRGCHNKWEHGAVGEMVRLRCFVNDMRYLLDKDPRRYWRRYFAVVDEDDLCSTPRLREVISALCENKVYRPK